MKNEKLIRTAINRFEVAARIMGKLESKKPPPRSISAQLNELYFAKSALIDKIEDSQA